MFTSFVTLTLPLHPLIARKYFLFCLRDWRLTTIFCVSLQPGMFIATMAESPYTKLLDEPACYLPSGTDLKIPGHPKITNFVGVRLEAQNGDTLGAFCIVNSQALEESFGIVDALKPRTMRELDQLCEKERLMKAKDEARLDAESKIKFLADMSHEIRYRVEKYK